MRDFVQNLSHHQTEGIAMALKRKSSASIFSMHHVFFHAAFSLHNKPLEKGLAKRVIKNMRQHRFNQDPLGQLHSSLLAYRSGRIEARKEIYGWLLSFTKVLEYQSPLEVGRKRFSISNYWFRRLEIQKEYEAAMVPIKGRLAYLRKMKTRLNKPRWKRNEQGRQWCQANRPG
jgi:hypothetical protein